MKFRSRTSIGATFPTTIFILLIGFNWLESSTAIWRTNFGDKLGAVIRYFKSPNCSSENYLLRYDKEARECYEVGSKGKCGKNMIFYAVSDNDSYGVCDCAYAHESRTLIYHQPTNQCYFVFDQGYCRSGQWLTIDQQTQKPVCESNPCYSKVPAIFHGTTVLYEGTCVILNTICNTKNNGRVKFVKGFVLPRCTLPFSSSQAVGAPVQTCAPGSHKAFNGKCAPLFVW